MAHQDISMQLSDQQPTRARFVVLMFLCTLALLLYIDRVCIGQAETSIREELGLNKDQMGWVYSAFILAYCLFEVPTGHLADRFGSRRIIARIVIWWSAFTALTGIAIGLWSLVIVRFLFGAGEAGAFPNTARVITRWFPLNERGKIRGTITFVSLLGAAIAPVIAAYLIKAVGWRWTFGVFGSLGVVWTVAFFVWFRDDPAEHPAVNEAELSRIGTQRSKTDASTHLPIPWGTVLSSPNVWLMSSIMLASATLFYTHFQWYATYLKEARAQTEVASGILAGAVMTTGAVGCLCGGLLVDLIIRSTQERKWSRRLCGGLALLMSAIAVAAVGIAPSALVATICFSVAMFFVQLAIPMWWTVVAEISGRHGASMWGLMNSMGGLGLMVVTKLEARFVESRQAQDLPPLECWHPVFYAIAGGLALGAVCWMLVDATRSIVGEQEPHEQTNT